MAAEALTVQAVASRLERQEEDIRWLCAEVQRLRDEQLRGPERGQAEGPRLTREVAQLRAENRDLRQRLVGLRLSLAERARAGRAAGQAEVTPAGCGGERGPGRAEGRPAAGSGAGRGTAGYVPPVLLCPACGTAGFPPVPKLTCRCHCSTAHSVDCRIFCSRNNIFICLKNN